MDTFFQQLSTDIEDFVSARDWQQFHSPKNLSMALSVEAAELVEHFQWLTPD
ncbi:MAG: nucleotide pyrophosphohydrolase, partial [Pseudomonadota bacterium]|nr:nucleotide pyrophosphohydrolase [Pseudomonadota bacterium]